MNIIRSFFIKVLSFPIKIYRLFSPYKKAKCCKYYPTCSEYALTAIERYGPLKGSFMAGWRILRCNPFSKGGYDPVPEVRDRRRIKIEFYSSDKK